MFQEQRLQLSPRHGSLFQLLLGLLGFFVALQDAGSIAFFRYAIFSGSNPKIEAPVIFAGEIAQIIEPVIPFFQLYWLFQAYWGYAKDYNSYISRYDISTSRLPEGLFLAYCILPFVYAFVYAFVYTGVIIWLAIIMTDWSLTTMLFVSFMLAIVLAIPMFVIGIIILVKLCDAVNNLSAKTQC